MSAEKASTVIGVLPMAVSHALLQFPALPARFEAGHREPAGAPLQRGHHWRGRSPAVAAAVPRLFLFVLTPLADGLPGLNRRNPGEPLAANRSQDSDQRRKPDRP